MRRIRDAVGDGEIVEEVVAHDEGIFENICAENRE